MLSELFVENFALIEKLQVGFDAGLNVITGETGAGKSLIIDAVGLLLGGRASQEYVRAETEKALIQGTFSGPFSDDVYVLLNDAGLEIEDDILILCREIQRSGKHSCRINFRTVPLSFYREIGRKLINIHGQHEHVALLDEQNQLILLDSYGGESILTLREEVGKSFNNLQKINRQVEQIKKNSIDAARQIDLLNYQIKEIDGAALKNGEEEELYEERKLLQNAERLALESRFVYEKLYGSRQAGVGDLINEACKVLKQLTGIDVRLQPICERLDGLYYEMEDIIREIETYQESVVSDPARLEAVEKRILEINKLKKKYGNSLDEIINFFKEAKKELDQLQHQEDSIKELEEALEKERNNYQAFSSRLTELRKDSADRLSHAITGELHLLQMPDAVFKADIQLADKGTMGNDSVCFLISPNQGEGLKPVSKIASGGEMSRIMLGIKVILAGLDGIPTLIFDEIDSGLGGRVVYAVGEKLGIISEETQIICVTHSPVVASFANNHLFIAKDTISGRTVTKINKLNDQQILKELCRMLAGDNATETTMAQAEELLQMGSKKKNF